MAACDDRQLTQAEREAAYEQQRTGVVRALRPFSGSPTVENLIDYINRELGPAVRSARDKVNDIYLQVADQAPSANPLHYFFAESVVDADPTPGRIRLNQAIQNTATVIRISETNAQLDSAFPWLDVMAGSATVPIGVVTLVDAKNPGRFVRWDLESMVDMGSYWNLNVTPLESSHPSPFVEGEAVTLGFIPGVASSAGGGAKPILPPPMFLPRRNAEDEGRRGMALPGVQGIPGAPGAPSGAGRDGEDGRTGRPGLGGTAGAAGVSGRPGRAGEDARRPLVGSTSASASSSVATVNAGQQLGRQIDSGASGASPIALTGAEQGENIRFAGTQTTGAGGTLDDFAIDPLTDVLDVTASTVFRGFAANSFAAEGKRVWVRSVGAIEVVFKHEDTNSVAANRFRCPNELDFKLLRRDAVELVYSSGRWTVMERARDWQNSTAVTWAAQQDDLSVTGKDRLRVTLTGDQTLTGMVPRAASADNDGQTLLIENIDQSDSLTIAHSSGSSSANNQFRCPGEVDFILGPRCGVVARYDGTSLLWRLLTPVSSTGQLIAYTEYTSGSGTHTYDVRARLVVAHLQGGGGGGGGAEGSLTAYRVASGGQAGEFEERVVVPTEASGAYAVGAAGAGGVGTTGSTANGTNGGNTTLVLGGSTRTASGGGGTSTRTSGGTVVEAAPRAGIVAAAGEAGDFGLLLGATGPGVTGKGGGTRYGPGGVARTFAAGAAGGSQAGADGVGAGAAGSGAYAQATTGDADGGNGQDGLLRIWEFS